MEHDSQRDARIDPLSDLLVDDGATRAERAEDAENPKKRLRKDRCIWTPELHQKFEDAIRMLGIDQAKPMAILGLMQEPSLTKANIKSHLQKYRSKLQIVARNQHEALAGLTMLSSLADPHGSEADDAHKQMAMHMRRNLQPPQLRRNLQPLLIASDLVSSSVGALTQGVIQGAHLDARCGQVAGADAPSAASPPGYVAAPLPPGYAAAPPPGYALPPGYVAVPPPPNHVPTPWPGSAAASLAHQVELPRDHQVQLPRGHHQVEMSPMQPLIAPTAPPPATSAPAADGAAAAPAADPLLPVAPVPAPAPAASLSAAGAKSRRKGKREKEGRVTWRMCILDHSRPSEMTMTKQVWNSSASATCHASASVAPVEPLLRALGWHEGAAEGVGAPRAERVETQASTLSTVASSQQASPLHEEQWVTLPDPAFHRSVARWNPSAEGMLDAAFQQHAHLPAIVRQTLSEDPRVGGSHDQVTKWFRNRRRSAVIGVAPPTRVEGDETDDVEGDETDDVPGAVDPIHLLVMDE